MAENAQEQQIESSGNGAKSVVKIHEQPVSAIESGQAAMSRSKSTNSSLPTNGSKRHWQQPTTVRQFASQVNAVATRVLNGEIDMDVARTYASLTRVLAQAISVDVTRSRFLQQAPDLSLDDEFLESAP